MSKKLSKQQVGFLIKEAIENKLLEREIASQVDEIYSSRQDLQSAILVGLMEEISGRPISDPTVLDEGVWEKAKSMLAKIRLSKSTGAAQQRDALEAAADKAANKQFSQLMGSLKQMPGFDKYPNNESEEEFVGITTAIGLMHQAVSEAHKDGMIETDTANSLISNLKSYADGLNKDLSYSYRYLNEDDEEDTLDEGRLNEREFTNYNRAIKLLKYVQDTPVAKMKPRKLKAFLRIKQGLEKELTKRTASDGADGIMGMTNKEQDLLSKFEANKALFRKKGIKSLKVPDKAKGAVDAIAKGGAGGGGGSAAASPDVPGGEGPELGPEMDPGMEDEFGNYSDPGDADLAPGEEDFFGNFSDDGKITPGIGSGGGGTSLGDIDGVSSLPKLYQKAGSMATLSSWLGPGFLQSLAGFALPVAGIAGIAGLVGKRLMGKSREGSLKKLSGMMAPVDASEQGTEAPEPAGAEAGADDAGGMQPGAIDLDSDPQAAQGGAGAAPARGTPAPAAGGAPAPAAGGAPKPAAPGATPEPPEEDEEEKKAREDHYNIQEVKRWQKIAGIIKG